MEQALSKLTAVTTSLSSHQNNLQIALSSVSTSVVQKDASTNYLSTAYEAVIPKMAQITRADKAINIGLILSEQMINSILDQLIKAAS